jgi:hypothetical protein
VSDIFQEIDEDLRRERLLGFWRRYGTVVIALGIGLLVGIGAYIGWRNYAEAKLNDHAQSLAAAAKLVSEGKHADAAKAFEALAAEAGGNYGAFARLDAAAATYDAGDKAAAVALYDQVAASDSDSTLRALAQVLAVQALMDTASVDELNKRLEAIGDSGFAPAVKELRAYVRLKKGDTPEARRLLAEVIDDATAPTRLKTRATEVLDALGGRLAEPAPVTPAPVTPAPATPQPDQPTQSEAPRQ